MTLLRAELAAVAMPAPTPLQQPRLLAAPEPPKPNDRLPKVADRRLPDSQVLEAYRYSGVPRDELPKTVEPGR
jgi:hypothetical protein